ncbi:MAG: FHIPEP family type III secretion protein, partial [Gammaproteobacteria bacterium]|nr:FHIPEP family type III secretion protein [Gammaproteobacteria bacterium]
MASGNSLASQTAFLGIDWRLIGLGAPLLVVMLLAMMILPLPPFLLDFFFTFNIALSLIILLVAVYIHRPLEFGVFPSVLLIMT